ncbi:hypothetical protein [Iodobacter fluviatilis]|uniref:Uncharacterized protein n=1 Tax=Iodobacter fluviatilis TaxID=537 RepID=A0A7G3GB50_9NEIS|nr:hypothetical protein [Iodobacter fluviatilis]QBC44476.1 hypothetical protein C1H71_13660 [Iodobacter fluviatilis]
MPVKTVLRAQLFDKFFTLQDQVIQRLRLSGGSLWVPSLADNALMADGSGGVAIDGQVGYVRDLASGTHQTQATTANKPLLRRGVVTGGVSAATGQLWWEFDGVNDTLASPISPPSNELALIGSGFFNTQVTATHQALASKRNTTAEGILYKTPAGGLETWSSNAGGAWRGVPVGSLLAANTPFVLSSIGALASQTGRLNGGSNTAVSAGRAGVATPIRIGSIEGSAFYWGGGIYGLIAVAAAPSASDLALYEKYLASLSGVALL